LRRGSSCCVPSSPTAGNAAELAAKAILEARGNTPRLYRNTLVFLAADKTRLQDLDEAARRYLAWESILGEKVQLDLSPHQVKQAETQRDAADSAVTARLPETYQWLLVPVQSSPQTAVEWQAVRISGPDALAVRASKKLRSDELLVTSFAATLLKMELDRVPLWRGEHVTVKQLAEDFARYLYLPRLKDSTVLGEAIESGLKLISWNPETFAYAEGWDEQTGRYKALRAQELIRIDFDGKGLLVKAEVAARQMGEDAARRGTGAGPPIDGSEGDPDRRIPPSKPVPPPEPPVQAFRRFHGSVDLDPARTGRDASRIAEEVITHLAGLVGATVRVTLEIEAEIPSGAPDHVVRTVTENSRTLKFTTQGFETQ
jgi:hypothetical protein